MTIIARQMFTTMDKELFKDKKDSIDSLKKEFQSITDAQTLIMINATISIVFTILYKTDLLIIFSFFCFGCFFTLQKMTV